MRIWKSLPLAIPTAAQSEPMSLRCRLITPVFGGGVDPKNADERTPLRVPALRGALRFWWRATSALTDVDTLREAESVIFGGVAGKVPRASQVSLAVIGRPVSGAEIRVFKNGDKFKRETTLGPGIGYAAFALREPSTLQHAVLRRYEAEFTLEVRCAAAVRAEVERALWALLHFGGFGGRTRRGFGALELMSGTTGFTLRGIDEGWPRELPSAPLWPVLATKPRLSVRPNVTAMDALELGLNELYKMRQGTDGRAYEDKKPKRSFWPEADALRVLSRRSSPGHQPVDGAIVKFPRAAFGAPLRFQFKDSRQGDPEESELVPMSGGKLLARMASPLIIRPHLGPDGRYRVLALKLAVPNVDWALKGSWIKGNRPVSTRLTPAEATFSPLDGIPDPVDVYLERVQKL